jgi:hypothetical protein
MTDIVDELREYPDSFVWKAADEIELLRGLLRETRHPTQFVVIPPGWQERRDAYLRSAE